MINLTSTQRRELKARAHLLHPVVMVGNAGLTPSVIREIDVALKSHELIKIRVFGDDRTARATLVDTVCTQLNAATVQHIGKILVFYRPRPDDESTPAESRKNGKSGDDAKKTSPRSRARQGPRRTKRSFQA